MKRLADGFYVCLPIFGIIFSSWALQDNPSQWPYSVTLLVCNFLLLYFILMTRFPRA